MEFNVLWWGKLVEGGQLFLLSCKNNLSILIWDHVHNIILLQLLCHD